LAYANIPTAETAEIQTYLGQVKENAFITNRTNPTDFVQFQRNNALRMEAFQRN